MHGVARRMETSRLAISTTPTRCNHQPGTASLCTKLLTDRWSLHLIRSQGYGSALRIDEDNISMTSKLLCNRAIAALKLVRFEHAIQDGKDC